MKRSCLTVALVLLAVGSLAAQSARTPSVSLRLALGLSYAGYREETYSTILQLLDSSSWSIDVDIDDEVLLHRVSAGFTMGPTHSSVSNTATLERFYDEYTGLPMTVALASPVTAVKGHLAYSLAASAVNKGAYSGFLGGSLRIDGLIQLANYPSVSAIFALGPVYRQAYALTGLDRIELDLAAPLLAYAVRPPYAGADAELMHTAATNPLALFAMGSFMSLGRYQGIQADFSYVHSAAPDVALVYCASASLFRIAVPLPRTDAEVDLRAGAALGL
jgi:hypothetical protein